MSRSHQFFPINSPSSQPTSNSDISSRRTKKTAMSTAAREYINKITALQNSHTNLQTLLSTIKKGRPQKNAEPTSETSIPTAMNPLGYELGDVVSMIALVPAANEVTLNILQNMYSLAIEAADGTRSEDELKALNRTYQGLKKYIAYAQTINLIAGPKAVGGGSVTIWLGDGESIRDQLKVSLNAIDIKSLGIESSNLLSVADAEVALSDLYPACETVVENLATSVLLIDDAVSLIRTIPYVLSQVIEQFALIRNLAMLAATGTTSDADRSLLNRVFNSLKSELDKTQTVVTDDGVKNIGQGAITIQIGDTISDLTSLSIPLPVTDVVKLGLDKHNVLTIKNALATLTALNDALRDVVYGQNNYEQYDKDSADTYSDDILSEETEEAELSEETEEEAEDDRSVRLRR